MPKIGKVLACHRPNVSDTRLLYQHVVHKYCFVNADKKLSLNKCFVIPYSILTDGHDIVCFVRDTGTIELGLANIVRKPSLFRRLSSGFDDLVQDSVINQFKQVFNEIKMCDRPLLDSDLFLVSTNCAVTSDDYLQVYPIYFLKFKHDSVIKVLCSLPQGVGLAALNLDFILSKNLVDNMPHVSSLVTSMLERGIVSLPNRQEGFV